MTEERLSILEEEMRAHVASHNRMEEQLDNLQGDIKQLSSKVEPLLELWSGFGSLSMVLRGVSGVVIALGAIGIGLTWLINHLR